MNTMYYTIFTKFGSRVVVQFFLVVFLLFFASNVYSEMMSISGNKVNLRSGPGTKYAVKWEYGSGFPVKVLQHKGNWAKIRDFEGDTGWIHTSLLSKNQQVIVRANKGKEKKINIREKPGTKSSIVGQAYYGVVFKALQKKADWIKVKHDSGLTGWIKQSLLWGY